MHLGELEAAPLYALTVNKSEPVAQTTRSGLLQNLSAVY